VLVKIVSDFDQGTATVDLTAYAAALQMPLEQVDEALTVLQDSRFFEADEVRSGELLVTRVCPLARQILGSQPDGAASGSAATKPGAMFDEIVLRATTGP
jgi:hypothetical protein